MFKKFALFFIIFILIISSISSFSSKSEPSSKRMFPTAVRNISSSFGYRYIFGKYSFHNGTDFPAREGSPVFASVSGVVTFTGFMTGYGNSIIILHNDGYTSLYGHLSSQPNVSVSSNVTAGDTISTVGPKFLSDGRLNGYTTGAHLHFSIFDQNKKAVDPMTFNYDN